MPKRLLLVLGASLWLSAVLVGQTLTGVSEDDRIFGLGKTHRVRVSVSQEEWVVLQTSGNRAGITPGGTPSIGGTDFQQPDGRLVHISSGFRTLFPYVRADLLLNDVDIKEVGLRYKGNNSFVKPTPARPFTANLKIKTDLFGGKDDWHGAETLNFHAGGRDPSLMREALAFAIFRAAGVPAPRTAYAELTFQVPGLHDNASGGTFVLVENVNKRFLKRVLPPGTGLLMKPEGTRGGVLSQGSNWAAYIPIFRPDRDATPHEQQRTIEFAGLISQTDTALFREKIGTYLDVDEFLRFVAVHVFIGNNDSYVGNGNHNYYLYLDPKDDKFRFIPWDEDLSMNVGRGAIVVARGGIVAGRGGVVAAGPNGIVVGPNGIVAGPNGNVAGPGGNVAGPDILQPPNNNNALIYWLLDDPAVAEQYRAIVKDLSETVFTEPVLNNLIAEVERAVPNRDPATKNFLLSRAAQVKAAIATLPK